MTGAPDPARAHGRAGRVWAGRLLRVGLAVLPIAWLARRVDPAAALGDAAAIGWGPVLGAAGLLGLSIALGTLRWATLLRAYGADRLPPFSRLLKNMFISGYFNVLPSGLAGDVFRALRVRGVFGAPPAGADPPPSQAGASAAPASPVGAALTVMVMERIVGLLALLVIVAVTALTGAGLGAGLVALAFRVACAGAAVLSVGLLLVPWILSRWPGARAWVSRVPLVAGPLLRIAPPRHPAGVALAVAISFGTQGLALLIAELLLYRVASSDQLVAAARTLPFAILLTFVPITPGAVAQREAIYTLFLGLAGVSPDRAVAVAVLSFTVQLTAAGVGGLLYAAERLGWLAAE